MFVLEQSTMGQLGEFIRAARHARGLSATELADLVEVSQGFVSHIENGRKTPTNELCERLADVLGVDAVELLALRLVETGEVPPGALTVDQARDLIRRLREDE